MTSNTTLKELNSLTKSSLAEVYSVSEASAMTRIVMEEMLHASPVDIVMKGDEPIMPETAMRVNAVVERLRSHEPIQYVFGHTDWCGLTLKVTPDVLIPRPETAALVDMIVKRWGDISDLRVMDLCTGSGCIAIALSRALKFATVEALDLSPEALAVARDNATSLKARVKFSQSDVTTLSPPPSPQVDIIVSNPPYIPLCERHEVDINVAGHEPDMALYVADSAPLLFYEAITRFASAALRPGGGLYFEINPHYANQIGKLLNQWGFNEVTLLPDICGKTRYATAILPHD